MRPYQACPALGVGEAPEPQGRLETSGLLRRFSVTAHGSRHHHKRRKAGPTPPAAGQQPCVQPRGGSELIRCSGASSRAGKTSCAPRRLTAAACEPGALHRSQGSARTAAAVTPWGFPVCWRRSRRNPRAPVMRLCLLHYHTRGTAETLCPDQRHSLEKRCWAKVIPKSSEIGVCLRR